MVGNRSQCCGLRAVLSVALVVSTVSTKSKTLFGVSVLLVLLTTTLNVVTVAVKPSMPPQRRAAHVDFQRQVINVVGRGLGILRVADQHRPEVDVAQIEADAAHSGEGARHVPTHF